MADSALTTFTDRQIVGADHRIGMRRDNLLTLPPTRAALTATITLLYFVHLTTAYDAQKYVVCKDLTSHRCYLSLVESDYDAFGKSELQWNRQFKCFVSDLIPSSANQRFIAVDQYDNGPRRRVLCKTISVVKNKEFSRLFLDVQNLNRVRRTVGSSSRGRYRGQTQSQYLAVERGNNKDEGKAEAHSDVDSSRATVSGNSGMGQAQSQSMYDPSCEDCLERSDIGAESLKRPGGTFGHSGTTDTGPGYGRGPNGEWNSHGSVPGTDYNSRFGQPNGNEGYGPNKDRRPGQTGSVAGPDGSSGGVHPPFIQNQNGIHHGNDGEPNYGAGQYYPNGSGGREPGGGQGPNGSHRPGSGTGQYGPAGSGGQGLGGAGGQGPGGSSASQPGDKNGLNGPYGPGSLNGQYGPDRSDGLGPGSTGGQRPYGPSGMGGKDGQYGSPGSAGRFWPSVGDTGTSGPGGKYEPGWTGPGVTGVPGADETYKPGTTGNNDQYGPGGIKNVGKYQPGSTGGREQSGTGQGPNGQFSPGGSNNQRPGDQYGPGGSDRPGFEGHYNIGGPGIQRPGSQYGTGGDNRQYSPDGPDGSGPGGQYIPNGNNGRRPNGQYNPSRVDGQYNPSGMGGQRPTGQYNPGGQYNSGVPGSQSLGPGARGDHGAGPPGSPASGSQNNMYPLQPGVQNRYPGGPGTNSYNNKWPTISGSFVGADGLNYICCAVNPNFGVIGPGNTGGQGVGGQYGPGSTSGQGPGSYYPSSGTNGQYGPGAGGQGPGIHYPPSGTGGTGGQYGPGVTGSQGGPGVAGTQSPGDQYGPAGIGREVPGSQYSPGGTGGHSNEGRYGPGNFGNQGTGGNYSPEMTGPGNQYGNIGRPGGQYGTGSSNGQGPGISGGGGQSTGGLGPGSQYGGGGDNSGGQYGPSNTGDNQGTNGQYRPNGPGGHVPGGEYRPGQFGQYGPGSGDNSGYRPGGQYNPNSNGGAGGQYGPNGQYGPGIAGGQYGGGQPGQGTGGAYNPGGIGGGDRGNGGQYGPGGTGGQYGPEGQFRPGMESGGAGGNYGPGAPSYGEQYGPGGTSGPGHEGQYRPTGTQGSKDQYGPGTSNGHGPGGEYGPDSRGPGEQRPGGQYGSGTSGGPGGTVGPGNTHGPGTSVGSGPAGDYGSGGQRPNGQYEPGGIGGQGSDAHGSPGGHYGPSGSSDPEGQYGPGRPSESGGQYGPGTSGGKYGPETSGGQFGPGGTNGHGTGGPGGQMGGENNQVPPQNVIDPKTVADGDDSAAEASVSQAANGTVASASSKGGNNKGRAQTHVTGTYTGSGSFSAQAEISGENKAANSQVSGDKKGASSTAQGSGRNNKSQANVKLGSETGSVITGSQSDGLLHSSNSQVQGSVKGGMADAQAKGPGSTSSQAQIGFTPYKEGDKSHDVQKTPFIGGGVSSAQSNGRTGMSQSQLHGTFKYGITYNGAAQAGSSLDKDAVFPNRLPFDKIDVFDEANKNINVNEDNTEKIEDLPPAPEITTEVPFDSDIETETNKGDAINNSDNAYAPHKHADHHQPSELTGTTRAPPVESRRSFQSPYSGNNGDYEYSTDKDENQPEDYDVDDGFGPEGNDLAEPEQGYINTSSNEFSRDAELTHQSLHSPKRKGVEVRQTTGGNTQHILLGSLSGQDAIITQKNSDRPDESRIYQPGERVPGTGGYVIPRGFTGSIKSVASKDNTYVQGSKDSPSQAQTISLTPGSGKVKYKYPSYGSNINRKNLRSLYNPRSEDNNRYVSVSKSVTRDLDNDNNVRKQYSHTYYTKSSSCGYFTFTCTMVSSAEGKKRVCKPKIPLSPDGTPIRC